MKHSAKQGENQALRQDKAQSSATPVHVIEFKWVPVAPSGSKFTADDDNLVKSITQIDKANSFHITGALKEATLKQVQKK